MTQTEINKMIAKFSIELTTSDNGIESLRAWGVKTPQQAAELRAAKPEVIAELKKRAAEKAEEEAERQQHIENIKNGMEKIVPKWHDGEYLQGWEVYGEEAEMLERIGAAEYVSGWGYEIKPQVVEALGSEFTYAQAVEYMQPENDAKAAKKAKAAAERAAKFQQAKETGKPIKLVSYSDECDGSVDECNLDIITVYAMPDGSTKTTRTHTF